MKLHSRKKKHSKTRKHLGGLARHIRSVSTKYILLWRRGIHKTSENCCIMLRADHFHREKMKTSTSAFSFIKRKQSKYYSWFFKKTQRQRTLFVSGDTDATIQWKLFATRKNKQQQVWMWRWPYHSSTSLIPRMCICICQINECRRHKCQKLRCKWAV